ncbi:MAG: aminoglycoside phosphotransferase family protein [Bacteroidales bacterium]|nr:aminoglycoside phosphotransferase family protein [Bacteroidales bacterium]MDZ4204957.1 aminoglycoside phosphotransferase family protein [Bacteroidales bacterium]
MHESIIQRFFPSKKVTAVIPFGRGHINETFRVHFEGEQESYILQRINTQVFVNPQQIVENHLKVQKHLTQTNHKIIIPRLLKTVENEYIFFDQHQNAWRMTNFVENSYTLEIVTEEWQASEAGNAFGWFARACSGLNALDLVEVIPNFHRLSFRLEQLDEAITNNKANILATVTELTDFYLQRRDQLMLIETLTDTGIIPQHVVHNDTKINNLLFRDEKAVAVIDLDTVGPGVLFYDYGDAIRTISNTAGEDEQNICQVDFNFKFFSVFSRAYLGQVKSMLVFPDEEFFYLAPVLMTYIMGIRFLTDYLNGDVYYKTSYPDHNLVRSRVQKKLIECMEAQADEMKNAIAEI